ncbi:MAG: carbohydrate ABC transporter permease [Acholeplasmataceae bacterium]|jgi:multiple sugar transport system permease protein|nr:carbohydrate ABC transporter permease [Acholeplasmataceae bacterium]
MNRKLKLKSTLVIGLLFLITAVSIVPFIWMISTSLKSSQALMSIPIEWIPKKVSFESYMKVLTELPFLKSTLNSLIVTLSSTFLTLISASMAAFIFAKYEFRFKNTLFILFLTSMMVSIQVTGIPIFIILTKLGLNNSFVGVVIPSIYNVFAIFLLRQYMKNISNDFIEAAYMDGANLFQVFFKIIVPMSIVPLTTLFVINFMAYWNDYFWPLIILTDPNKVTLPVLLSKLNTQYNTEYNTLMAGSLVSMIPILIVYMFAQKHFIKGVQEGGIK